MRQSAKVMLALAVLGLTIIPWVHADSVVIDFESLMVNDAVTIHTIFGSTYSEDGFTLTTGGSLRFFGTLDSRFSGSTALFNGIPNGITELTQTNGNPFTLTSIDLAELNGSNVASVTFLGNLFGGGTVTQTFTLDGMAFGAETFSFSNVFTNLTSLTWTQVTPFHQFDNIVVDGMVYVPVLDGMVYVPEPATLTLLGIGLLGGGVARFRKRFK